MYVLTFYINSESSKKMIVELPHLNRNPIIGVKNEVTCLRVVIRTDTKKKSFAIKNAYMIQMTKK